MPQTLYTGPKGVCDDCGKRLDVRLGSLVGKVNLKQWRAHPELVAAIYQDMRGVMRTNAPVVSVRCKTCRTLDPKRLLWVGLSGGVGADPQGRLGGPYCGRCFRGAVRHLFESHTGAPAELPVYYVQLSPAVMMRVRGTPAKITEAEETPVGDEVDGLF